MNILHPKKSYKLNYLAVVPPLMGILSEIGVWMPILNIFSIFLGIMGIIFGVWYIIKLKKCTKKKISEFGLIALGNMAWIVAMGTCAVMKFSSASYANNTGSDFINQLTGFKYQSTEKNSIKNAQTMADQNTNYGVNDTAEFKGIKITLTQVNKNFKMNNHSPKKGSKFIKLSVKVENTSDSEINVSENDMKIKENSGAMENPNSVTYSLNDQFESAILISGGAREGSVVFEVPENDDDLKFIYAFPLQDGERAEFDL